tara:strand:+ start:572 stop:796 length:225 start_codon:yes stop_codon:yes gene_type:complete
MGAALYRGVFLSGLWRHAAPLFLTGCGVMQHITLLDGLRRYEASFFYALWRAAGAAYGMNAALCRVTFFWWVAA